MAEFLSPEWMGQVQAGAPALDPGLTFTMVQVVRDSPRGDVAFSVRIAGGALTIVPGSAADADVTLRLSYGASVALATGRTTVHDAVLEGAVKVSGDLDRLQAATGALAAVAEAMGSLRSQTLYPD